MHLARGLLLGAGLVLGVIALVFMLYLSSFTDSTRATNDLAALRTHAYQVALAADRSVHEQDPWVLEDAILRNQIVTGDLSNHLHGALPAAEADALLGAVDRSWNDTIGTARLFADGDAEFDEVVASVDRTGAAVDELMMVLADRGEAQTDRLKSVLRAGIVLLAIGGFLLVSAFLRQRRRSSEVDALTGVLARDRFRAQLAVALLNRRQLTKLAVAVVDVDRFRRINKTLGAEQGDRVLRDVARRIQDALPAGASVGRRSGDEFLILLPEQDAEGARDVAQRVLASLDRPLVYQTGELRAGVSIGLAVAPDDGVDAKALLDAADAARDDAKADGGGTYRFVRGGSTNAPAEDALALEIELRNALKQDEFELFYQPQVDIRTGEIVGAEALLRWRSPSRGLVSPDHFIPLLEESRLIVPVGAWAIHSAALQAKDWVGLADRPFRVAVNISARQLLQSDLVSTVRDALGASGLPPANLELEVTETVAIQNPDEAVRVLEALAALGVQSALDDFGTGHSWLSHLKLLPRMSLKIDRSFVSGITKNAEDRAIVAGLITVAHTLQRTVVAEGVERAGELALLEEMHCDIAQGFYFSRPVPAAEFTALLQRAHPWAPDSAA